MTFGDRAGWILASRQKVRLKIQNAEANPAVAANSQENWMCGPQTLPLSYEQHHVLQWDALRLDCECGKAFSPPGAKRFKCMLNGLINFLICLTPHLLMYTRHFCQFKHLNLHLAYQWDQPLSILVLPEHLQRAAPIQTDATGPAWGDNISGPCHGYVCVRRKRGHSHAGADQKPPRVGLQYHPGCMDVVNLVPTKASTLELSDATFLLC